MAVSEVINLKETFTPQQIAEFLNLMNACTLVSPTFGNYDDEKKEDYLTFFNLLQTKVLNLKK